MKSFFYILLLFLVLPSNASQYDGIVINEILVRNASSNLESRYSNYSDWIEIYNAGNEPVDLRGCYFTNDWSVPQKERIRYGTVIEPKQFRLFWCDGNRVRDHIGLKLKSDDETIALFTPEGQSIDAFYQVPHHVDVSYGRYPDGGSSFVYFDEPTPGSSNTQIGNSLYERSQEPQFSLESGVYQGRQTLELTSLSENTEIYYTIDGSIPTRESIKYERPMRFYRTRVVRARAYEEGRLPSGTITQSYFVNDYRSLPIISIATNPEHLFDSKIGIYVEGTRGIEKYCSEGPRNWNQDWERPISIEMYEPDGELDFRIEAGMKINGGCSRTRDQKSLAVYFRDQYGPKKLYNHLFSQKSISEFSSFILRNAGNDNGQTQFRDALMHNIVLGQMDIDAQASRPSVLYINGDYWGIYNIREKINESYVENNHGVDSDNIDILQNNGDVFEGEADHYKELISYISKNDLRNKRHYEYVKDRIDINEYINYQIAQIYFSNTDWPGNNIKYWRPRTETDKWRWLLFDTDFGFNFKDGGLSHNTLQFALATNGPDWPNPPWSTLLFRKLIVNRDFSNEFAQRFAACFTSLFSPERVQSIINECKTTIEAEMPDHIDRWRKPTSTRTWEAQVQKTISFARYRPRILKRHIQNYFSLNDPIDVTFTVSDPGKGIIYAHEIPQTDNQISTELFGEIPIQLKAAPMPGYRFLRWRGVSNTTLSDTLRVEASAGQTIQAIFERGNSLVINEIHYNPDSSQGDGDSEFIELFNASRATIDVGKYSLNQAIRFTFPEGATIEPGEYVLIARNAERYQNHNVTVYQWVSGKLANKGEEIRLTDRFGNLIDSVRYETSNPWPDSPNGQGFTLSLIDSSDDNASSLNWRSSETKGGTPGTKNQTASPFTSVANWIIH